MRRHDCRGFTLVELLVVISIVGVLIGLLLPAVQAARESARRTECANNLRQLALACLQHEGRQGFFPSAGWGNQWVGDASRGFGTNQPGSWLFSILPFLDESNVYQLGDAAAEADRRVQIAKQNQHIVSYFYCPSRRIPRVRQTTLSPRNSVRLQQIVRTDYAANSGSAGDARLPSVQGPANNPASISAFLRGELASLRRTHTGVIYGGSEITVSQIADGLTKTFLVGEKNLDPQHYETGRAINDNQGAYTGYNWDNCRAARENLPPSPDTPGTIGNGINSTWAARFGSAHIDVWQVAYCDGSVTSLSYTVNGIVAGQLANRRDGYPVILP